jgi:predicted nucleic acid-binding protein
MIVADLVAGDSVFVDSNILIYHFGPHPAFGTLCSQLVQRIENRELHGFSSTHVLGEVGHQLMIMEASKQPGWTPGKVKRRLQKQRGVLRTLTRFRTALESVLQSQIDVLTLLPSMLGSALTICQQYDLLINDAMIVALMQAHGLSKIASHDADFDRVPGITRYAPS